MQDGSDHKIGQVEPKDGSREECLARLSLYMDPTWHVVPHQGILCMLLYRDVQGNGVQGVV